MWMLVRGNATSPDADGATTLAACPDSPERGDPWRWSVRRIRVHGSAHAPGPTPQAADQWRVAVDHDPDHIQAELTMHVGEALELTRLPGEELVVVPLRGQHLIAHATGPWRRWVSPGDVFVVEGEQTEELLLRPAPGGARVALVRLSPTTAPALRWVP